MSESKDKNLDVNPKFDEQKAKTLPEEEVIETSHQIIIAGQTIDYVAQTGTLLLKNDEDEDSAAIFFVAYLRKDSTKVEQRPITFSFNGGPGSSSVWMHMGLLGPRRVLLDDMGQAPPPPYQLVG